MKLFRLMDEIAGAVPPPPPPPPLSPGASPVSLEQHQISSEMQDHKMARVMGVNEALQDKVNSSNKIIKDSACCYTDANNLIEKVKYIYCTLSKHETRHKQPNITEQIVIRPPTFCQWRKNNYFCLKKV